MKNIDKVIKENIDRYILNELEYPTYDSAYKQALERGNVELAKKFAQARNKAFNTKFGTVVDNGTRDGFKVEMQGDGEHSLSMMQTDPKHYEGYIKKPNEKDYRHFGGSYDGWETVNNFHGHSDNVSANNNKRYARSIAKAENEYNDFINGMYQYEKGKGYIKKGKPQGASIENADGTPNVGRQPSNKDWHEYI